MSRVKRWLERAAPEWLLSYLRQLHYARQIKSFHEPECDFLGRWIRPGDTVLDIGANAGWYTRILSGLVGPAGHVYAFEPVPSTYEALAYNVRRLGLANVVAMNRAVSGAPGTVTMEVPRWDDGRENYYQAHMVEGRAASPALRQFAVEAISLDASVLPEVPRVSLVKCDVEGNELAVIQGAAGLVERDRPVWLMEISGSMETPGSEAAAILERMTGWGYGPYVLDGENRLRRWSRGARFVNCFFLTEEHARALDAPEKLAPGSEPGSGAGRGDA